MKNLISIACGLALVFALAAPTLVLAQANTSGAGAQPNTSGSGSTASFTLIDPLGVKNFCDLVKSLLNVVMAIGLPVAVLFLVWSGFRFILARGNQKELGDAKKNFQFVILGIAIFLGAWTLATIISATIQTLDTSGTVQFCGR